MIKEGLTPGKTHPTITYIDVMGRKEHEAVLMDPEKCTTLGLDRSFEVIAYLKRWGSWLEEEDGLNTHAE